MSTFFTCRQGHRWEQDVAAASPAPGQPVLCPVCGGAAASGEAAGPAPAAPSQTGEGSAGEPPVAASPEYATVTPSWEVVPAGSRYATLATPAEAPSPGSVVAAPSSEPALPAPGPGPSLSAAAGAATAGAEGATGPGRPASLPPTVVWAERPLVKEERPPLASEKLAGQPPGIPGYQILGMLGQGGMGVVYKARQLSLNRLVALKMVLAGSRATPHQLARFHLEAEAVARLQHPNIVQIYEVGEYNHCPYFSLELVDGGSLEDRLAGKPQPPREAAGLVEVLARAMHHAHQHGIVHRDLKPANILLAKIGNAEDADATEDRGARPKQAVASDPRASVASASSAFHSSVPKITDFGLAKRLEEESGQTQEGMIVGTPSYMAPEQAGGKTKDIGPLADVYALGAILYELLTGRPPFQGDSALDTLQQVQSQEPIALARLHLRVPRDLETICHKCLEKEPSKRYASAEALAEDLRRFRAGEPIRARPVGAGERVVKWAKRRPAVAALLAVSSAAVAALLAVAGWSYVRVQAEAERAEDHLRLARTAVDDIYAEVAHQWLDDEPDKDLVQLRFLRTARTVYEKLAQQTSTDPVIRRKTALAHFRVAEIYRALREDQPAEDAYHQAITLQDQLRREFPNEPGYRQDLAQSYNWLGELLRSTGHRLPEAEEAFGQALGLQTRLAAEFPGHPEYRAELARTHYNLGIVQMETGRPDQAEASFDRAVDLLAGLKTHLHARPEHRRELARVYLNRGKLLGKDPSRANKAEADFTAAIRLLRELTGEFPSKGGYRYELAVSYNNRANLLLHDRPRLKEAEADSDQARDLCERLAREFPGRPVYRYELGNCCNTRGGVLFAQQPREAERAWRDALAHFEGLVAKFPEVADYRAGLGRVQGNLALVLLQRKENEKARGHLEAAVHHLAAARQRNPDNPHYRQALYNQYRNLAETSVELKDPVAARKAARQLPVLLPDDGESYYFAACFLARCIPPAEEQDRPAAAGKALAQDYAEEATGFLRQALAKNYDRVNWNGPELAALQTHSGFRKLKATWQAKSGPAAK
jgi:serine/threonine protein kinase/Tfp pilus assembly protein PilF